MRFSAATTAGRLLPQSVFARARPLLDRIDGLIGANGGAGRVSLIAFTFRIFNAIIAFASQVLLARWMGGFEYGIFVLVWVTMVIVGNIACFGFHTTVIRFIPQYREQGRLAHLRGILVASRLFVLAASTAIAAIGAAGIWLFAPAIDSYYVLPFYLGVICLPMIALSDMLQGIARANAWAVSALSSAYVVRPILIIGFMAGALALDYEANAVTAVTAAILATYATTLLQFVSVTTRADAGVPAGPRAYDMKLWIAVSLPIFLVESFFFLLTNADVLMVGAYMAPHDVGVYYATVKTLALVHFVYFAVKAGVAQRYAQLMQGDAAGLARFARQTVSWTFWPSLLMGAAVLALGQPILSLFGPGFDQGYPLLVPLVLGVTARAAIGPAESLLTMTGNQNACAAVYGGALALNIVLNVLLIPVWGLWGAAIATTLAMVAETVVLAVIIRRRLGITMFILSSGSSAEAA